MAWPSWLFFACKRLLASGVTPWFYVVSAEAVLVPGVGEPGFALGGPYGTLLFSDSGREVWQRNSRPVNFSF